jgi:alpha-tubulin suppressor-like RCC1 family protein
VFACGANNGQLGSIVQSDQGQTVMVPRKVHALHDIIDVKASEQMTAILTRQRHIILLAHSATRTVCFTAATGVSRLAV